MTAGISKEFNSTRSNILETISSFPGEDFNTVPSENSWSAAQVAEHIFKSLSGVLELLQAPASPTTRDPQEKIASIKDMFLDFTAKMKSPEFVLPGETPISKEDIYKKLDETLDKIEAIILTKDLSATSTVFELPGFGPFTLAEWIWFGIYHTQRHTRQLKNIEAAVTC